MRANIYFFAYIQYTFLPPLWADAIAEELPEEILDDEPTILELTNHVTDGVNPHLMGVSLGLADNQQQRFDGIIRRTK